MDQRKRDDVNLLLSWFARADSAIVYFDRVGDREERKIGIGRELCAVVAEALDLLSKVEDEER